MKDVLKVLFGWLAPTEVAAAGSIASDAASHAARTCASCRHFSDHSQPDDDPDEPNGYCCHDFTMGVVSNEYGGHWTHSASWCRDWSAGNDWKPSPSGGNVGPNFGAGLLERSK